MQNFDWIIIGAGITGAALAYEISRQGQTVLLLDRTPHLTDATRQSYGGIAHWAGATDLTRTLCAESLNIHRHLSVELDADTEYRDRETLLTISPDEDVAGIVADYQKFTVQPQQLTPQEAQQVEPLLNPNAIAAALLLPHGQIEPERTAIAYRQAAERLGTKYQIATVKQVRGTQVITDQGEFSAANIAICAGGMSRQLLQASGIQVPQHFSYAESIETVPVDLELRTIVMSAVLRRFELEAAASLPDREPDWDKPGQELASPILDVGALQFRNGHIRMGQLTRALSDPNAITQIDPAKSEATMRHQLTQLLPKIGALPGTWRCCTVAFSRDHLPTIGPIPGQPQIHLFTGFSNPMALVPSLARRYAAVVAGKPDRLLDALLPDRFMVH
jgi:glycine/D-amino acid oxidase-like deaminating enzyme